MAPTNEDKNENKKEDKPAPKRSAAGGKKAASGSAPRKTSSRAGGNTGSAGKSGGAGKGGAGAARRTGPGNGSAAKAQLQFPDNPFALITGASSGIGEALLHEFVKNGYNVVAVAQDEAKLLAATAEYQNLYSQVDIVPLAIDLTDEQGPQAIYDELARRGIEIEVLVNDAGQGQWGEFVAIPLARDIELIRLNIEALTRMTKLFLPDMVERNRGKVLNVGSIAGFQPGPLLAVYHATKAYVVSLCEALAEELKDTEVTVTCLCPGATETAFFEKADMQDTRVYRNRESTMMQPAEVAKAGYEALMNGERVIIPGIMNKITTFSRRVMPVSLQAKSQKQYYETSEESAS